MKKEEFTKLQNLIDEKEDKIKQLEIINNVTNKSKFKILGNTGIIGRELNEYDGTIVPYSTEKIYYLKSDILIELLISFKDVLSKEISDLEEKIDSYFDK